VKYSVCSGPSNALYWYRVERKAIWVAIRDLGPRPRTCLNKRQRPSPNQSRACEYRPDEPPAQPLAAIIGRLVGVPTEQGRDLSLDILRQCACAPLCNTSVSGSAKFPGWESWKTLSVGRGVSLLCWRSEGVEHPQDTVPYPFMPSPASAHSWPTSTPPVSRSHSCARRRAASWSSARLSTNTLARRDGSCCCGAVLFRLWWLRALHGMAPDRRADPRLPLGIVLVTEGACTTVTARHTQR
jgi:hypothetical protein